MEKPRRDIVDRPRHGPRDGHAPHDAVDAHRGHVLRPMHPNHNPRDLVRNRRRRSATRHEHPAPDHRRGAPWRINHNSRSRSSSSSSSSSHSGSTGSSRSSTSSSQLSRRGRYDRARDMRPVPPKASSPPPPPPPGPPPGSVVARPTKFKRVAGILSSPSAITSVLALLQHGINMAMRDRTQLSIRLSPGGGRRIDLVEVKKTIGVFRGVMAVADMVGIAQMARALYTSRNEPGQDKKLRVANWVEVLALGGFNAYESAEFLASQNIYRTSKSDNRHSNNAGGFMRHSSKFFLIAIAASFYKIYHEYMTDKKMKRAQTRAAKARRLRQGETQPQANEHDGERERKTRRKLRRRKILSNAFWTPVTAAYARKKSPFSGVTNSAFTVLAHVTKIHGLWADSAPPKAGQLSSSLSPAMPVMHHRRRPHPLDPGANGPGIRPMPRRR